MKLGTKIGAALAGVALAVTGAFVAAPAANAGSGSTVVNTGSVWYIKVQQWPNGAVRDVPPGHGGLMTAQAVVIPFGQCYRIQRAPGYTYGEYCNTTYKGSRYITVPDYQNWKAYRSR